MKKVLFVATVVKKHIMVFHLPFLKMFREAGWETAVAAQNDYDCPGDCAIPFCDSYFDIPFERSPFSLKNIRAYKKLKKLIDDGEYDIIHCHTPVGALLTRLAAIKARKKGTKVFYTAHGFHFYDGAPLQNWLLYYPVERLLARWTDVLITINKEDYERAGNFKAGTVEYVPGVGVDTERFNAFLSKRARKRDELGIKKDSFALFTCVDFRFEHSCDVLFNALAHLKENCNSDDIVCLIFCFGEADELLKKRASDMGIRAEMFSASECSDISGLCAASDIFVSLSCSPSCDAALVEAVSFGLPLVCTDKPGPAELVRQGENGEITGNDAASLARAVMKLKSDVRLRECYGEASAQKAKHNDFEKYFDTLPDSEKQYYKCIRSMLDSQKLKERLNIPSDAKVLLSVGEINKNKNHRVIIEALPGLENTVYLICGQGPLMDEYRKLAESLGVSDRLIMPGFVSGLERYYRLADVFVFPSLREGLPVSVIEAMASGLPVICTRIRGSADLVEEEKNGLFIEADHPETIIKALKKMQDENLCFYAENMRKAKNYSLPMIENRYRKIYGID